MFILLPNWIFIFESVVRGCFTTEVPKLRPVVRYRVRNCSVHGHKEKKSKKKKIYSTDYQYRMYQICVHLQFVFGIMS